MANQENLDDGYIALYRSSIRHQLFQNKPDAWWKIWCYMLLRANRISRIIDTDAGPTELPVGAFLGSLRSIEKGTHKSLSEIRSCLHWLEKNEMVTQQITHHFTVYRVVNFGFYQPKPREVAQQTTQASHTHRTPLTHPSHKTRGNREEVEEKTTTCASDDARGFALTPLELKPNGRRSKNGPAPRGWKWEAFEGWWAEYWRRTAKQPAWIAYHELIAVPQDAAACKAAMLKARGPMLEREEEKRPYGATWLHRRTWLPEFRDAEEIPVEHDLSWAVEP